MKKAPKEDPPLLARPETPDDFERFEAQAFEVRFSDQESTDKGVDGPLLDSRSDTEVRMRP